MFYNAYIQQINFDGKDYTKGEFANLKETFGCGVMSFPFKPFSEPKEAVTRDWVDEDGTDIYIPQGGQLLKPYEIDVEFVFKGTEDTVRTKVKSFLKFIHGRNTNGSGRLCIYDEFVGFGRKDIRVKGIDPDILFLGEGADDVATFKVKFEVCDPITDVTLVKAQNGAVTSLTFEGLKTT